MKTILFIIMGIVLVNLVSAIYPGESMNVTLDFDLYTNYSISGNLSFIDIFIENDTCVISIPSDAELQSFIVTFEGYNSEPRVVHVEKTCPSCGGGTRTIYKDRNITQEVIIEKIINTCEDCFLDEEDDRIILSKRFFTTNIMINLLVSLLLIFGLFKLITYFKSKSRIKDTISK